MLLRCFCYFFCNFVPIKSYYIGNMNTLYLLQFACFIVTLMLAILLVASRFQIRWPNRHYETSRWLICISMLGLSAHYVLQMTYGLRATSDAIGAVVNILFYTPIALIISYATFNVICFREGRRRFKLVSISCYILIVVAFVSGVLASGSLLIGRSMLWLMVFLFTVSLIYCLGTTIREIRHHRKIMEEESGEDLLPYDRYTWASYLLMALSVMVLIGGIVYRPFLFFIGPLMLLSLIFFTITFIGYGFNIMPQDTLLEDAEAEDAMDQEEEDKQEESGAEGESELSTSTLEPDRMAYIEQRLEEWVAAGGFKDSTVNMPALSKKLKVSRVNLSQYFASSSTGSFRVWLSNIRFKEAQRMLRENPAYSNDTVSSECGFSSRAHLYKIFKANTGMTPGQWKETIQ